MVDKIRQIVNESTLGDNDKYYWGYQYELGRMFIAPYLQAKGAFKPGMSVAEIGSAEGGVLHSLVAAGAKDAIGTDINVPRLETGRKISEMTHLDVTYYDHDIIFDEPAKEWVNKFDLVILRDVIEHLSDTYTAIANIQKVIKPGGHLFVTFPPYMSPYGGHQHTVAGNFFSRLPYIHLLKLDTFMNLISSGRQNDIEEARRLYDIRLTPEKFKNAAAKAQYEIVHEDYYLSRPVFKIKFGLPIVRLKALRQSKFVQNYIVTEAAYLLKKPI